MKEFCALFLVLIGISSPTISSVTSPSLTYVQRSLNNKTEDLLEIRSDLSVDVFFLTETWHDADSVCIAKLRREGFSLV